MINTMHFVLLVSLVLASLSSTLLPSSMDEVMVAAVVDNTFAEWLLAYL